MEAIGAYSTWVTGTLLIMPCFGLPVIEQRAAQAGIARRRVEIDIVLAKHEDQTRAVARWNGVQIELLLPQNHIRQNSHASSSRQSNFGSQPSSRAALRMSYTDAWGFPS